MVSSEWGLPPQFENGIVPEDLLANKYGHRVHFWDLRARRNVQTIDLGANHQMVLEVRPHTTLSRSTASSSCRRHDEPGGLNWTWWREGGLIARRRRQFLQKQQRRRACRRCFRASRLFRHW